MILNYCASEAFHLVGIPAAHLRQMTRRLHTSGSPRLRDEHLAPLEEHFVCSKCDSLRREGPLYITSAWHGLVGLIRLWAALHCTKVMY